MPMVMARVAEGASAKDAVARHRPRHLPCGGAPAQQPGPDQTEVSRGHDYYRAEDHDGTQHRTEQELGQDHQAGAGEHEHTDYQQDAPLCFHLSLPAARSRLWPTQKAEPTATTLRKSSARFT